MGVTQFTTTGGVVIEGIKFLNGTIDLDGNPDAIILDADGDTTISASIDDQIDFKVGGSVDFSIKNDTFLVNSGAKISSGGLTGIFYPIAAQQDITDGGAISLASYYTAITTTVQSLYTLADGETPGQMKKIQMVSDSGDAILTPNSLDTYNTITFDTVGEYILLAWNGTAWVAIEYGNDNTGTAAGPTLV
jgi:hypothetical protein